MEDMAEYGHAEHESGQLTQKAYLTAISHNTKPTAMDNKELPKDVQDRVKAQLSDYTPDFYLEDYTKDTIAIFQSHYEPLLSSKDKEIEAKDKRISDLEAEVMKVMGLLKEEVMNRAAWDENDTSYWNNYCKEHHITDLGGE